jgi:hypothetical protein
MEKRESPSERRDPGRGRKESPREKREPGRERKASPRERKESPRERKELTRDDSLNSITPTSGLDHLVRHAIYRTWTPELDEDGNPVSRPSSPLRWSMQPLENLAERVKRKSFYEDSSASSSLDADDADLPSRLLALPNELQFLVISSLGLSDIERLRRTCQYYRQLLSPDYVRALVGGHLGLASQLTGHCQTCLESPERHGLILQTENQPLSSKCFSCSLQARELSVGTAVPLADASKAWVCRWCGWPVVGPHSWASEQFHISCYDGYYRVLWMFLLLGFAQFAVGVVAAALSLVYFRKELVVFAPTVVSPSLS